MNFKHQFKLSPFWGLKILIIALLLILSVQQLYADEMSSGEMAGMIRSANQPCTKVLDLQRTGKNSWRVQCNSGGFSVTRDKDGNVSVITLDQSSKNK